MLPCTGARSRTSGALVATLSMGVVFVTTSPVAGQVVYPATPDWESANPHYSTGAALVDLDRDGWLDLVVADGNDIQRGRLNVYYNDGTGALPTVASWQSDDVAYNGHLDVADVNGDGWPDVAVAHLGRYENTAPIARLYLNDGGTLSSAPDWTADVHGHAFGLAFGDVNADGRPDLAVGTGWAYSPQRFYPNYVYLNVNGELEPTASWESQDLHTYQGVLWVDGDGDGRLDLVGLGHGEETKLYRNLGGVLDDGATWSTTDSADQDGIMLAAGDVNGDGVVDLFATDNDQLGGSGFFKQYLGDPDGFFDTESSWSYFDGYGSAVALADVNADGRLDLATGAWWDHTRIFFNNGAGFDADPSWSSGVTSVVEKIVFGDVDPACGVEMRRFARFGSAGDRQLFHLPRQPVQGITQVRRDGVVLAPHEYTFSRERGWISVGTAPTASLEVIYTDAHAPDMVVSNWDGGVGNFLYYCSMIADCNENEIADGCDIDAGTSDDVNANGIPDECECIGDVDGSGAIDFGDLLLVLSHWGACEGCPEDLDASGAVDFGDLLVVLSGWGGC